MDQRKIDYLKKYTMKKDGYVRLISTDEIGQIDTLPKAWYEIFRERTIKHRIQILLGIWKRYLGTELRNTISYLNNCLENIELMEINKRYSILYTIRNRQGKILYYEGRSPCEDFKNEPLRGAWDRIPAKIRLFYDNIHNGFYYYASGAMGLVSLENVAFLGDDDFDWSIIDDLKDPMEIDLNTSFGFFSNGMGTYVAIDYQNCEQGNATLWSSEDQPEYNINFWDFIDEWMVIGFEA
ncbi:SMI1/KNR4 family protein [Sporolactobacillus sp. KGMB 08714]|uniref:SMI1/KNR4 family protein n=1 Tax=Sporolactobacillus sp. KGMB 08714 TaxID=3064704 RepID=UPI002FBE16D8